jgi:hypothetical protein
MSSRHMIPRRSDLLGMDWELAYLGEGSNAHLTTSRLAMLDKTASMFPMQLLSMHVGCDGVAWECMVTSLFQWGTKCEQWRMNVASGCG